MEGVLRSTGHKTDRLETRGDTKGEVCVAPLLHAGRGAAEVVAEALEGAIRSFPWPKSMRWSVGRCRAGPSPAEGPPRRAAEARRGGRMAAPFRPVLPRPVRS